MRIDAHVHYSTDEGYVDRLVEEEKRVGFDKVCINGAVWFEFDEGNAGVERAVELSLIHI